MSYNGFMAMQILAAKLYIPPPRSKIVSRPRLLLQLNEILNRRMTLVSAPAGFGKSTLISEWIVNCGQKAAWLSLDENDNDPARFWVYFISSLQTISPNLGDEVLDALQSTQISSIESVLTNLLNEISGIQSDFILVLDDYHLVDSPAIDDALTFLVNHLPPRMHLVITTREDPSLPLSRLRARNQLVEIRAADLRFTPSEAAIFLNKVMELGLSLDDVGALETRTEGWIAGLQLSALSLQGQKDSGTFIKSFTGTNRFVLDYLVDDVLQQQPETIQNFLLCTSILSRMCGPLCDAVLFDAPGSAQEKLKYIERANLFVFSLDNERHWYRYHHLFADLLRHRLEIDKTAEEIAQYHIRAGAWYEKNGNMEEAFRHLIAARDFRRAAVLVETTWQKMYESFQIGVWLDWVKDVPEELIRTRPVLCTQIAWALMDAHQVDASESRLRDAERCLEGPSDGMAVVNQEQFHSLPARIAFARAYNAQTRRDFKAAIKFAELALELIPEEDQSMRAQSAAILGATYLLNGDLEEACRSMDDWIEHSLKAENYFSAFAYAMVEKADILATQGHLREALRTYQKSLQLASEHDSQVLRVMAHPYLGISILYHEMGDDKAADQHFQKSLEVAGLHRSVDWSYRRCIAQARLNESVGDLDTALELLDEARSFYIKTLTPHTRPLDAIKARIYLKQGRLSKAKEWVDKQGLSVDDELIYVGEFEHIVLSRVLLAEYQDNRDEQIILRSLHLLDRLLKPAEDKKRLGSMLQILVTQVLAYKAKGDASNARASLERALTLAHPEGYFRIFVDEGESLRSMLLDLRRTIEKQSRGTNQELLMYADRLLFGFAQPRTVQQSRLVEPLSQRELETLRFLRTELSVPEIARELVVAVSTVRSHTKSIYSKLGVNNRRAAVKRADELNLI
jgi:LuxR family transcriptional regulator, maltose regulon positive regulatory protein